MSCYEWEEGTIAIPADQWSKVRKAIIRAHNTQPEYKKAPLPVSRSCTLYYDSVQVTLRNDNKTITWHVYEGNHAREHAAASWLGQAVFQALNSVQWPSKGKAGGVLTGNDEYNREDRECGGGANYITAHYGPAGKKLFSTYHRF